MEQKECRFRAETAPSKQLMKEAYGAVMWHSWRAWVYIAAIALGLGLAAYHIDDARIWSARGYGDAWKNNMIMIVYCLLLAVYLLVRLFTAPGLSARRFMRRLEAVHGDISTMKITYFFHDDLICTRSTSGQKIETAYDQITAVHETAHGIVLRRKEHLFETMDKSAVEGGTPGDFKAFLREKMPGAKFHWKRNGYEENDGGRPG